MSGGRIDVFTLDQVTDYDFGQTLAVVEAGEMLDLLDTPGNRFLDADINGRKTLFAEQLLKLQTFKFVLQILSEAKKGAMPADVVKEELVFRFRTIDCEKMLKW